MFDNNFCCVPQVNQQMSGLTLNGAGGQMTFAQPQSAVAGWAAAGSGQTLSTQLWKWAFKWVAGRAERRWRLQKVLHLPAMPVSSRSAFRTWKLYLSLSLCLFLSVVWVDWDSYRISAWQLLPVVWFLIITFIFLFWKKYKEITVPTKMISTYQKSCRTSYTSFYCITVSLSDYRMNSI